MGGGLGDLGGPHGLDHASLTYAGNVAEQGGYLAAGGLGGLAGTVFHFNHLFDNIIICICYQNFVQRSLDHQSWKIMGLVLVREKLGYLIKKKLEIEWILNFFSLLESPFFSSILVACTGFSFRFVYIFM